MTERLGPEVKLALLVGHEAGGSEETGAEGQRELRGSVGSWREKPTRERKGWAALTWPRRRPVFLAAADVRSDRRSSASC